MLKKSLIFGMVLSAAAGILLSCRNIPEPKSVTLTGEWKIVCRKNADASEKYAASKIQEYLRKCANLKLPVTDSGHPAIVLKPDSKLAPEEWHVAFEQNGDLVIRGGVPGGVLYGAFEWIEQVLGCRYLAPRTESIPRLETVKMSASLELKGKPVFLMRNIYLSNPVRFLDQDYFLRLKQTNTLPDYHQYFLTGQRFGKPAGGHTFYYYSKDFPADKPEYFALTKDGTRPKAVSGIGPGQICLSHPDVRKLVGRKMLEFIRQDRQEAAQTGLAFPRLYSLTKNDNRFNCVCPGCLALLKKYGNHHSGVNLDFVNAVAAEVKKEFPDVRLVTFAYHDDEEPPEGIVPAENVMVQIAQLGSEYKTRINRDSIRSVEHPNNRMALKILSGWARIGKCIIWDYWRLFGQLFPAPRANVHATAQTLRHYHRLGIRHFFTESEIDPGNACNFLDLTHYLGARMMVQPETSEEAVIGEFMRLYFGPAAVPMTAYLEYLERRMMEEPYPLGSIPPNAMRYLDRQFFLDSEKCFREAERLAAHDPEILKRIGQERIPVDLCLLNFGERRKVPFDRQQVLKRLRVNYAVFTEKYAAPKWHESWKNAIRRMLSIYEKKLPAPAELQGKRILLDRFGDSLQTDVVQVKTPDSSAAGGSAARLSTLKVVTDMPDLHKQPLKLEVFDQLRKESQRVREIRSADYPQDEKYHWYKVGRCRLTAGSVLYAHPCRWLVQKNIALAFDPMQPDREYEIWVSLKLTGPSYVKNSGQEDAVWLDRVIVATPE